LDFCFSLRPPNLDNVLVLSTEARDSDSDGLDDRIDTDDDNDGILDIDDLDDDNDAIPDAGELDYLSIR
jgi:hypothetical protein